MTNEQLKDALDELKSPLLVKRSSQAMQRVFSIYKEIAGREPRGRNCYQCAVDSYYELKKINQLGKGWDNSINLPKHFITKKENQMSQLKKYKMLVGRLRQFGSPDTITPENATDEKIDALIAKNPQFSKFFEIIEKPSKKKKAESESASEEAEIESNDTDVPQEEETSSNEAVEPPVTPKKKGGRMPKKK